MKTVAIAAAALLVASGAMAAEVEVEQTNKSFSTKTLKLKKGDSVKFTNRDPFFHNVFSLSPTKTFDLGSYPKNESKTVTFDKAGHVDVECAIHPSMQLSVDVEE